jgi:hypothetical protein
MFMPISSTSAPSVRAAFFLNALAPLPSPREMVLTALSAMPDVDESQAVFTATPSLQHFSERLAEQITDMVPTTSGEEPLLHAAIREGWQAFLNYPRSKATTNRRVVAFARAIIARMIEVNNVRIYVLVDGDPTVWVPLTETLLSFRQRHYPTVPQLLIEPYVPQVDKRTLTQMFAARIVGLPQIHHLTGTLDALLEDSP